MKNLNKNYNVNSMTKKITTFLFITALLLVLSCSKDETKIEPVVYQEEDFLDGFLTASLFKNLTTNVINSNDYELGTEFIPLLKGKITSINVKLPEANNALRVTIWDLNTGVKLKTVLVDVVTRNTIINLDIEDINLIKNNEYAITMNSNDWYTHRKNRETFGVATPPVIYPFTVGNIKIIGSKTLLGTAQTYPTTVFNEEYRGDLSFNFLRTE